MVSFLVLLAFPVFRAFHKSTSAITLRTNFINVAMGQNNKNGVAPDAKEPINDVDVRPPWHTLIVFICMSLGIFQSLPSLQKLDEIATLSTFTVRYFPNILSLHQLCFLRAAIAVFIWTVTLHMVTCRVGWEQMTPYKPQSKLKMAPNLLIGRKSLYPFTSW
jgi:Na+/H+ antiporter NhaD/arsenite permease-like protein